MKEITYVEHALALAEKDEEITALRAENEKLKEALAECCRMFEWCDVRYGTLLPPAPTKGEK